MTKRHRWLVAALLAWAALGAVLLGGLLLDDGDGLGAPPESTPLLEPVAAPPVERVETRLLDRGQTLGALLARNGFDGDARATLLLALREHVNPRRVRPGVEVTIRRWAEDGSTRAVELRLDADRTIRVDRDAVGWAGHVVLTPTALDTVYAAGTIGEGRSLWETIQTDEQIPPRERPNVADRLAGVYMFKLDFFHDIRPGDAYRMAYEREIRPDGSARRLRILAAEIHNRDTPHPAIYFDPNGDDGDYYDLEGRSLRRAFRRYPLDYVRVTSSFSWRRYHPVLGRYRAHLGTDFGANHGTRVLATGDGTIRFAGRNGGYGNFIEIRHPGGYVTRYAHLNRFARGIARGRRVTQGQVIGYVGATGLATGPHLHYEFRRGGRALNPARVDLPGGPPVPNALRDEFMRVSEQRVALLERVVLPDGARFATVGGGDAGAAPDAR